jgi:hypothetical protein
MHIDPAAPSHTVCDFDTSSLAFIALTVTTSLRPPYSRRPPEAGTCLPLDAGFAAFLVAADPGVDDRTAGRQGID